MADINVEQRRGSPWPWIVGLVLAALLVWGLVRVFGGEDAATPDGVPAAETVGP